MKNIKRFNFLIFLSLLVVFFLSSCQKDVEDSQALDASRVPVLTTNVISNISQIEATSGGIVTSDGGAVVTSRGVCWSTNPKPTITDAHTTNGVGTGSFTSHLTGLSIGGTYHVRAYATNNIGTAYGEERSFTTSILLELGLNYAGGIIFYLDTSGTHGLVCATTDQDSSAGWGCPNVQISGADAALVGTGLQNTIDITTGCATTDCAAALCFGLTLNGYSDWYLPSKEELRLMYTNLKSQGFGNFRNGAYWSSTEMTNIFAWQVIFTNGLTQGGNKNSLSSVRAIRSF